MKKIATFDYSSCLSCSMCVQACPISCIEMTKLGKQGKYKNIFPEHLNDKCIGCGSCAKACVMDCITIIEL